VWFSKVDGRLSTRIVDSKSIIGIATFKRRQRAP
jgi:hypothetical protein